MKAIVTGLNGTVAPVLARLLRERGHSVVGWDRTQVAPDDPAAVAGFLRAERPDWVFHVATGSPAWAEQIARVSCELGCGLLFTGSVSVFGPQQVAPLTPDLTPEPNDDYGRYKYTCEQLVRAAHPGALVARLAWQIGNTPGSNTMVDYIERGVRADGVLRASTRWYPACAFLADSAAAMLQLITNYPAGIYHLDGNPGLSLYAIATGLRAALGRDWLIEPSDAPAFDNRMHDQRIAVTPISERI